MHACSRSSCGGENGLRTYEPPFLGRFWAFFALGNTEKAHVSTRSTLAVVKDSICAVVSPPCAIHTSARKTHQTRTSWILAVGVVE